MSRASFVDSVSELDGRSDEHIGSYYVETAALKRIRSASVASIGMVGLKGSGKTTLFRLLTEDWILEPKVIRVGLAPDKSEFDAFVDQLNCLQFASSVRQGMLLFLLQLIDENAQHLPADDDPKFSKWLARKVSLLKPGTAALELLKRFRGLSILGCGIEIAEAKGKRSAFGIRQVSQRDQTAIRSLLKDFAQFGVRIRIVVDDPDRLFSRNGRADPHLLAGYILATNDISKAFPFIQFVHIIKSNVIEELIEVEEISNLPSDYFDYISWSLSELHELIIARLRHAELAPRGIFVDELGATIRTLSEQIRNGPRDLLRYIELILKSAPDAMVSATTISANHSKFRRAAKRQMETIYSSLYGGIEPFLHETFTDAKSLTFDEFRARFKQQRLASQPDGVDYAQDWLRSADRAFRALIEAGTVDVLTEDGWKRPYEAGYFQFDPNDGGQIRKTAVFS